VLQGGSANVEKEKCIDYAELVGCDIGGVGKRSFKFQNM